MHKYTIKIIDDFMRRTTSRDYLKIGDWVQLEAKVRRQIKSTPSVRGEEALALVLALKKFFGCKKKVTKKFIHTRVDHWLRARNFNFICQKHAPAHNNSFSPAGRAETPAETYDLGFYHEHSDNNNKTTKAHHASRVVTFDNNLAPRIKARLPEIITTANQGKDENLNNLMNELLTETCSDEVAVRSLFYLRCESFDDKLLIGNMQLDAPINKDAWENPRVAAAINNKSNIYKVMVQQAIQEALRQGKTKLYFQAGHAAEIAQWYSEGSFRCREVITEENLAVYEKHHALQLKKLEKIKIGHHGDYWRKLDEVFSRGLVVKKTPYGAYTKLLGNTYLLPFIMDPAPLHNGYRQDRCKNDITINISLNLENYLKENVEKDKTSIQLGEALRMPDNYDLQTLASRITRFRQLQPGQELEMLKQRSLYVNLKLAYAERAPAKALEIINQIFDYVIPIDHEAQKQEKIAELEKLFSQNQDIYITTKDGRSHQVPLDDPGDTGKYGENTPYAPIKLYALLQPFLLKFNYHELVLKHVPGSEVIKTKGARFALCHKDDNRLWLINPIEEPKINNIAPKWLGISRARQREEDWTTETRIFDLYEHFLPSIFKKLNLDFKKSVLATRRNDRIIKAPVWEITTPMAELAQRNYICF